MGSRSDEVEGPYPLCPPPHGPLAIGEKRLPEEANGVTPIKPSLRQCRRGAQAGRTGMAPSPRTFGLWGGV